MRRILFFLFFNFSVLSLLHAQRELWGTSSSGGDNGDGFIFRTDSIGNNLEIIHHFKFEIDGEDISALTLASNHKLYGMAASGGTRSGSDVYAGGTFFEYDLATSTYRVLQSFGASNPDIPGVLIPLGSGNVSLTEISPGILYGIMHQGSYVFAYNINTGVFTKPFTVPQYNGGATNGPLQNKINQAFIKAADGNFYATTSTNSSCPIPNPYMGSIMRINAAGTSIAIRHRASCLVEDGYAYRSPLVERNGKLFGATNFGGANNKGVIFEYDFAANTYAKRFDFSNSVSPSETTSLVFGTNGKLYGTAHGGGIPEPMIGLPAGGGVLFEFDPIANTFEVKHSFTLAGQSIYDMGVFPSGLIKGPNNKLYGTTQYGVFEYNPATNTIRTSGRFNGLGFAPALVSVCRKPVYDHLAQSIITVCEGEPFSLDLLSSNSETASWKHNSITDAAQTSATLNISSFTTAAAGTWSCTLTNACGTTVTQAITLVIGDPEQPVVEANSSTDICEGESVLLIAPEGYTTYHWLSGETTRDISVTESGSYSVIVNNWCESDPSEPVEVIVNPLPATPQLTRQYDHGVVLIASGSSSGKYYWTLNDSPLSNETDRMTDAQEGLYHVYSVSDNNCRSSEAASLQVVITGDETSPDQDSVEIFPNPATGKINIRWSARSRTGKAEVYDGMGRYLLSVKQESKSDLNIIDLRELTVGIYFIRITQGSDITVQKLQLVK